LGLTVTFVSGIRRSGKSALIDVMIGQFCETRPHYVRLVQSHGDKHLPKQPARPTRDLGVASARWIEYDNERTFEVMQETLTAIHRRDRYGMVLIEADADPVLRHAYPYDHRVFVMPVPQEMGTVFREPAEAAEEMRRVLDDTTMFASEFFGLLAENSCDDADPSEERPDLSATQMRGFLYSPLGDELATRMLLHPRYNGLIESDVIVVNTAAIEATPATKPCLDRLARLLERMRGTCNRGGELFLCNMDGSQTRLPRALGKALKQLCQPGKRTTR
jgi:hypothetical protein